MRQRPLRKEDPPAPLPPRRTPAPPPANDNHARPGLKVLLACAGVAGVILAVALAL